MTVKEKLTIIQRLSGLTQEKLASRLGVTFAALNRWINGKASPRSKALAKIDELYLEYSGEKKVPAHVLDAKKNIIFGAQKKHQKVIKEILANPDIYDSFLLSLTYNSNRIEGSTLSEDDTAAIIFQNALLPDKSLAEHLEAKNHRAALEFLFTYLAAKKTIDEEFILKLHAILLNAIRPDAGDYRKHAVRIVGANMPTANYLKVPELMKRLAQEIQKKTPDVIKHIAEIHARFEQIHPFADGNGRVGRLLIHAMALKSNLPPVIIRQERRRFYMLYLNKTQTKNDISLLEDFICDALLDGYKILGRKR